MRYLVIGLVLLCLTLGLCIGSYIYVEGRISQIVEILNQTEQSLAGGLWNHAQTQVDHAQQIWKKSEKYFLVVLFHDHVDNISIAFSHLLYEISEQDLDDAQNFLIEARTILTDVMEMESFSAENIF